MNPRLLDTHIAAGAGADCSPTVGQIDQVFLGLIADPQSEPAGRSGLGGFARVLSFREEHREIADAEV